MKSIRLFKLKNVIVLLLSALMIFSVAGYLLCKNSITASAATQNQGEFCLTQTPMENLQLSSPVDVYFSDDITAIVEDKKLTVYVDGNQLDTSALSFTTIKQVKRLSKDVLLLSDNGTIYSVNLSTLAKTPVTDSNGDFIGGNCFDICNNYLITAYSTQAHVYRIQNGTFTKVNKMKDSILADYPIAINEKNQMFFVDETGLCKLELNTDGKKSTLYSAKPTKMIANDDYVYCVKDSKVTKIYITDGKTVDFKYSEIDYDYELGSPISYPHLIAFKGQNLLLGDSVSIQEFKTEADKLIFTGFAIAKHRTAFNRIGSEALDIEKYGSTLAALDTYKLTVIANCEDDYTNRANFSNYLLEDLKVDASEKTPNAFSLGNGSALLVYDKASSSSYLRILNLNNGSLGDKIFPKAGNIILDACYQSGFYYVLFSDSSQLNTSYVYKVSENSGECEKVSLSLGNSNVGLTVDVFGNVFTYTSSEVVKYTNNSNGIFSKSTLANVADVKKIATDLSGNIFILREGGLYRLVGGAISSVYKSAVIDKALVSFAMDYISNNVYFLHLNEEVVCGSTDIGNVAVSSIDVPKEFLTTGSATHLNTLAVYTPKDEAILYSVEKDTSNFTFKGVTSEKREYILVCEAQVSNNFTVCILLCEDGIVLANKSDIKKVEIKTNSAPTSAYMTTETSIYYHPLITPDAEYSLTSGTTKIRLPKGTVIYPETSVSVLGKDFYYSSVIIGGATYKGYVPKDFVSEEVSNTIEWQGFTYETLGESVVYADEDLKYPTLFTIANGQKVKVLSHGEKSCQVYYENNGSFMIGYVSSSTIKAPQDVAIRNVVIILVLTVGFTVTAFFIVIEKVKK